MIWRSLIARSPVVAGVWLGVFALAGALLIALLAQIPAYHRVDLGHYDAAYVQGFYDAEPALASSSLPPYLAGSDGTARWSRPTAAVLLFPQVALPSHITLRVRAHDPDGLSPTLTLLLNGSSLLASFPLSSDWAEYSVEVPSGVVKANDFFLELRTTPTTTLADGRTVGVLVDSVTYTVRGFPLRPYPTQVLYGALVGAMLWLLSSAWMRNASAPSAVLTLSAAGLLLYGTLWLLFYHNQPPFYPYPLRLLPLLVCSGLAALLILHYGPGLAIRVPSLLRVVAPIMIILLWTTATLLVAHDHVTLARPGVENDFRVFATRETLAQVFHADGFYNLGYPLLLWLTRMFYGGNAFLAGRLLAALSGALFLTGGYWLARQVLSPGSALFALLALALSGFVAQYGLYVGSDMPFAAAVSLCLALTVRAQQRVALPRAFPLGPIVAGMLAGIAFLMRHLGLVLLPWGMLALLVTGWRTTWRPALFFAAGFLLTAAPQLLVNIVQVGNPLYNQQAKNVWLAVYGNTDWSRWDEVPNSVGLTEVILRDPGRFLANWWHNVTGYLGHGAEDTSEFGRADQVRLLGWPANWLAIGGILAWVVAIYRAGPHFWSTLRHKPTETTEPISAPVSWFALVSLIVMYGAAVSMAFTLPRFFLPLAPIYAVAAGWTLARLARGERMLLGVGMVLVVVLWSGWSVGVRYALDLQPADEVAAVEMVESILPPDALFAAQVSARLPLAKYSAIAHRVVWGPMRSVDTSEPLLANDLADLQALGASFLLWDESAGPPPLSDPSGALMAVAGPYGLYRLVPMDLIDD